MTASGLFRKKDPNYIGDEAQGHGIAGLKRSLGAWDLTAYGIAAIIGAGIFSTIGKAASEGGPAISLLFIMVAVACAFSALCYAEFASSVPSGGSAYTYSYVAFGELIAWIIGWDLLLEYAIGNIVVAISWSDYFTGLWNSTLPNSPLPGWLSKGYFAVSGGETPAAKAVLDSAPTLLGHKIIIDLPAFVITALITTLVYIGITETKRANNFMVGLKLGVILLVIIAGSCFVDTANWHPFAPTGFSGIMKGVSAVFFAYIGFDAISTTAEECRNPAKDLPKGILNSLIVCTILYVIISLVLTGMVPYTQLNVGDPLASVFSQVGLVWIGNIVAVSGIIAMASVLLVFQMGQPRIWLNMSRDGLLPPRFARIHPRFRTPSFSTVLTGFLVAIPALFLKIDWLTDLTSIGTLFAFILVCGGIGLRHSKGEHIEVAGRTTFKVPRLEGKYILTILYITGWAVVLIAFPDSLSKLSYAEHGAQVVPMLVYLVLATAIVATSWVRRISLIPALGMLSCMYLLTELGVHNWVRFFIWLVLGLVIYALYGYRKSRLNRPQGLEA